jgi:hypothetical protein
VTAPGQDWLALVGQHGTPPFVAAFASDASLEASVLDDPLLGAEAIGRYFEATTGMYDSLEFVHETRDTTRVYLEWTGQFGGRAVGGVTIVTRRADGLIENVRLYLRPLSVVSSFAADLSRRLR